MIICTECPYCQSEIEMTIYVKKLLIGEEGDYFCPRCHERFDYEIRVLTTKAVEN